MKKALLLTMLFVILAIVMVGCASDADVASHNLSKSADNFEVQRRIIFINSVTGDYLLVIEGRCSLGNNDRVGRLSVTCKTGPDEYLKHFLGLSELVTFIVEQTEQTGVSTDHYRVFFNPSTIIPDIDLR